MKHIDRNGEKRINNQGLEMVVIDSSQGAHNLTVEFTRDGFVKHHVYWADFNSGKVRRDFSHKDKDIKYIGQKQQCKNGSLCEVIGYHRGTKHQGPRLDVKFDNGYTTTVSLSQWLSGIINDGSFFKSSDSQERHRAYCNTHKNDVQTAYIGKSFTSDRGVVYTVVDIKDNNAILQLEDDTMIVRSWENIRHNRLGVQDYFDGSPRIYKAGLSFTNAFGLAFYILKVSDKDNKRGDVLCGDNTILTNTLFGELPRRQSYASTYTPYSLNEMILAHYLSPFGFCKIHRGDFKHKGFGAMELDLYSEEHHIAIEYDGAIHAKRIENDKKKNIICKQNGIKIYRIRDIRAGRLNDGISTEIFIKNGRWFSYELQKALDTLIIDINQSSLLSIPNIDISRDKQIILDQYWNAIGISSDTPKIRLDK